MAFGGGNLLGLFGRGKKKDSKQPVQEGRTTVASPANGQRIISFRIDTELDRKLSRELSIRSETRSDFIRNAIMRALQQDAQARLRAAHSAITWG
jgi:hypothetical protein